jgi:tetratricopeptide (TPR) repeat protein
LKVKWVAAAIAVYFFALKFVFPGYIRPLSPQHVDFYMPPGLAFDQFTFWQHLRFPRPAGYFLLELLGLLGLDGWILVFILIALLSIVAVVRLCERLAGHDAYPIWVLLYLFLVMAHPSFYFDYVEDSLATASFLYLILAMHAWLSFKQTGLRRYLACTLALFLLTWTTKETFFLAALVFFGVEVLRTQGPQRRAALLMFGALPVTFAVGVLLNMSSINPFFVVHLGPSSPYYISFAPASVLHCYWILLWDMLTPVTLGIILLALGTLWRNRPALLYASTLFCAGLVTLLPNSVLPNHIDPMYAWEGACLAFSPVLFVGWSPSLRRPFQVAAAAALAAVLGFAAVRSNRSGYEHWNWWLEQEHQNRHILQSFPVLQHALGRRFLVTGITPSYSPWTVPSFIRYQFGPDHEWTLVLPREYHQVSEWPVTFAYASQVDITRFDHAFGYAEDGRLLRDWNAAELQRIAAQGDADRVLQPALIEPLDQLAKDPSNWFWLLRVGQIYADWGQLDQAERYLARSCQNNSGRNPYAPYFYGTVEAALGKTDSAIHLFEQAIEMDSKPGNPAFPAALRKARAKLHP